MLPVLHIQVCNANQQKRFKAGSKQELPKIEQLQNCTGEKPHHNHYKNKYNEFLKGDLGSVLLYFISETKNSTLMRLLFAVFLYQHSKSSYLYPGHWSTFLHFRPCHNGNRQHFQHKSTPKPCWGITWPPGQLSRCNTLETPVSVFPRSSSSMASLDQTQPCLAHKIWRALRRQWSGLHQWHASLIQTRLLGVIYVPAELCMSCTQDGSWDCKLW